MEKFIAISSNFNDLSSNYFSQLKQETDANSMAFITRYNLNKFIWD